MRISAARKLAQTRLAAPRGITSCGWGASRGTNKSFFLDAPLPSVQTLSALPPRAEVEEKLDLYVGQSEVDDQLACFVLEPEMYVDLDDEQLQGRSPEDIF
jgi:hypothetical protein